MEGLHEAGFEIFDAFCGNHLRTLVKVEYFDGNIAAIADLFQSGRNGFEIDVAETRSFQVLIIGMEMGEMRR